MKIAGRSAKLVLGVSAGVALVVFYLQTGKPYLRERSYRRNQEIADQVFRARYPELIKETKEE